MQNMVVEIMQKVISKRRDYVFLTKRPITKSVKVKKTSPLHDKLSIKMLNKEKEPNDEII